MSSSSRKGGALVATALSVTALVAGPAAADTNPSTARCPNGTPDLVECLVVKSTDGSIAANGKRLPLGNAITIEGGVTQNAAGDIAFVPPASGDALTAKPVPVPGGLFGRNLPYNLNNVSATVQQVGAVSVDPISNDITAPIRIRFDNPLLGSRCFIGSAASPISLHLTTGVTNPPPPNQPVAGFPGTYDGSVPGFLYTLRGVNQVDNAFAVPAATGCGVAFQSQVTASLNRNLGLPSAAGHNDATLTDDVFVAAPAGS